MNQILNRYNFTFVGLLLFHVLVLIFLANDFSIASNEIHVFHENKGIIGFLTNLFPNLFATTIIFIKLPFILLYAMSAIVLYLLTENYFKYQYDRVFAVSIFMLLPGVNSAALLMNESIIVIFCTLFYLYLYKLSGKENYFLLFLFLFIDNSFAILYLALFFYSIKKQNNFLLFFSLLFFGLSMSFYGFDMGGRPRGYFVDTFAIYASVFSPLLFLYFFYAIYRFGIKFERDMYWYLSMTALAFSLVISLRQKVYIEDFAPFIVIAIPVMVKLFLHSVRVRIKEHKGNYLFFAYLVMSVLILNFVVFVFNKSLYLVIENPKKHFAYDYHIAKELSEELKKLNIKSVNAESNELQERLEFYGITKSNGPKLIKGQLQDINYDISIEYFNKTVEKYDLVKN